MSTLRAVWDSPLWEFGWDLFGFVGAYHVLRWCLPRLRGNR